MRDPMRSLGTKIAELIFERRYGLDTTRHVDRMSLGLAHDDFFHYEPSGWLSLQTALPRSEVQPDDVFADLGSGLGRVVFQAALRYPFRRVIGVDLSSDLNEIARRNLEHNRDRLRCPDVEIVDSDLLDWEIPDDLTIAYLHNAITGEPFERLVQRLLEFADRRGRPVRLIYVNPTQRSRLLASGRARQVPLPRTLVGRLARGVPSMIQRYELGPRGDGTESAAEGQSAMRALALPLAGDLVSPLGIAAESIPY